MRIGITVDMRHSMFSAGHPNSCIAVCEAMQVGGHEVVFIKKDTEKVWWDDVFGIMGDYTIESVENCTKLDVLIEVAFHLTQIQRSMLSNRVVWYCRKAAIFTDIESSVFACRIEGRNMEGISEIWLSDLYNSSDDMEYLKTLYPSLNISIVPWLWTPTIVEAHRKEKQSPVWPQVIHHIPIETPWTLHIMESNASNTSSCTLPLLMVQKSGISRIIVHNTEMLCKSKFFKDNILDNIYPPDTIQLVGRQRAIDWSHEPRSLIVSHSRFIPLKLSNLEAVWVGIPLIHNNIALRDFGCGLEKLYYRDNNIQDASNCLQEVIGSNLKDIYINNIDILTELRTRILYKYSPEAKASEWLSILERKGITIAPIPKKKPYKILFTDMWADFNPEYNMFLLAIQEYLIDYEVIGTSIKGDHNIHIFGPFGSEWLRIEGPKIYFTGENTGPIDHPSVKLNIGFRHNDVSNYLRMPLWMFEIDWFGADLQKIKNPIPIPVESCINTVVQPRTKFCAFIVSNPNNKIRNDSFHILNKYKPVDSAGKLFNTVGDVIFAGPGGGGGELKKHLFLKDYKFSLCYENESSDGYVTEKLLHAKAAGCIPIYWGARDVVKDFDPRGFIHIVDPDTLVEKVREIDEDDTKWLEMTKIPALTNEKVDFVKTTFKNMAQKIVTVTDILLVTSCSLNFIPSLKRWLENIELHRKVIPNLKAYVYLASDIPDTIVPKKDFVSYIRFPTECPEGFPDFWNPQHFAWKLWILKEVSCNPLLRGSTVFYMDCGSVIIRWPYFWIEKVKIDKISFLDDTTQQNYQWCHTDFCEALKVTDEELKSNQIAACLIMLIPGEQLVIDFFSEALRLGSIRKVIVGDKWSGVNAENRPIGHRHDQSILSILGKRNNVARIKYDIVYNHISARATFYGGQYVYVHRGDYKSHVPLLEGIDDAYVINLDRRTDRLKSFVEHHPYFKGKVRRHKAVDGLELTMTPNLATLFKPNDFYWKKAVMGCALSHLKLWLVLDTDAREIQSYLIMEDDARLKPEWSQAWSMIQGRIPLDWECIYLGGVLPPNKDGFKEVLEETNVPGLCRIKPNTFFGQSVPSRQFHFCTYAYVLSRRGVERIMEKIQLQKGIWTSADHVLYNSLNKENVYVLNPLVAGASQDDDPAYLNSDFNDFSRIDKFDSDLWNNDERFSLDQVVTLNTSLAIKETLDEIYSQKVTPLQRYVSLDVCNITNDTIYEGPWLKDNLGTFNIEVVSLETDLTKYDNLVILIIRNKWKEQIEWIHSICKSGKKFKVLHFSDEFEQDPCFFYDRHEITGILRFYNRSDISNSKVLTLPLGYHWKNHSPMIPLEERKNIVSFHGTNWNGRLDQLKPLMKIIPSNIKFYDDWKHPEQLDEKSYLDLLLDTIFVPCPRGNNVETFRFYEALECGCIPVFTELPGVLHDSKLPLLKTETWNDIAYTIKYLNNDKTKLKEYHTRLMNAWAVYKTDLKRKVSDWLKN